MILTGEFDSYAEAARAVHALIGQQRPPQRIGADDEIRALRAIEDDPASPFAAQVAGVAARVEEHTLGHPEGHVTVRIIRPSNQPDAVYLDIHGGGFMFGSARMRDAPNLQLADECNVATVSVDYRLAPEHPWPAGLNDCVVVATWLLEHAARIFGTGRLLIGGESAGATLAALTLLRVRDELGAADCFIGANLLYGCYDLRGTPSQFQRDDTVLIDSESVRQVRDRVFPGLDPDQLRDPAISALYADLRGLPPALFTVGREDPLLDDSMFMALRWELAGNGSDLLVYPESPHGFPWFPTSMARIANARIEDFLRRCIVVGRSATAETD